MVYLTATLPPRQEKAFFDLINAREEDVVMIRTRTTRTNVGYSVKTMTATSAAEAGETMVRRVREILDEKLEAYPWPAKMIVYCHTVKATDALATALDCDAYHREVDTRDGKAERLRAWTSGLDASGEWIGSIWRVLWMLSSAGVVSRVGGGRSGRRVA